MTEDANRSLEYQYATTYHNLLDKVLVKRFDVLFPNFTDTPQTKKFAVDIVKKDLIAYGAYAVGYPIEESEYLILEDLLKRGNEAVAELDGWMKLWYVKWLERTKVVGSKQYNGMQTIVSKYVENNRMIDISGMLLAGLSDVALRVLIEEKEYACTYILAKDIVIYALREEYKNVNANMPIPDQLRLMSAVIRRTKSMANMKGPLVFIKVS